LENRGTFVIREVELLDVVKIYRMYRSLSSESKRLFHPFPETPFNPRFFQTWVVFSLSSIKPLRNLLLRVLPRLVYFSICCEYSGEVIGFAFIHLKNKAYGELGIVVRDGFQGRGIGSRLMKKIIGLARKNKLKKIHLTVLADNYKAIKLYEKFGFKKTRIIRGGDVYNSKKYDIIEMWLTL